MELDFSKNSRRDRMMLLKSFEINEVREIGQKEAGEFRSLPILWMKIMKNKRKRKAGKIEYVKRKIYAMARKVL